MQAYSKAIVAAVAGLVSILANFGVVVPPEYVSAFNSVIAGITPLLVYLVPNKAAK